MPNTTNNNWPTPADTDLVKNGADAIRDLGNAIDTTLGVYSPVTPGLVKINTTSFSGVASQAVNNVFSATYDNYKLIWDVVGSTSLALSFRLRLSTTDNTSSNYQEQFLNVSSTTVTAARATDTSWSNAITTDRTLFNMDLSNVFLSQTTAAYKTMVRNYTTAANIFNYTSAHSHTVSSSFDGFNLIASTGTITGSVSVYGYSK